MADRDLYTIVRPASESAKKPHPLLVLLHGLGSNEEDLMSFAPMLDPGLTVAAIRAPHRYEWGGFAWFAVEFGPEGRAIDQAQACESRDALVQTIPVLTDRLGADPRRTVLGGFSQGAMLSLGVVAAAPSSISRLLLMSGVALPIFEEELERHGVDLGGMPVLVTHGLHDPLLPVAEGKRMAELLRAAGAEVDYRQYPMAHEVSRECLDDIVAWLAS